MAKILFFDIETSPNIGYTWEKYDQTVIEFKKEWELLSFAWKWKGKDRVHCESQRHNNEAELVTKLHRLLSEADIVVAHNGDEFDMKKAKAKFLEFGLKPLPRKPSVDTKKVAKSNFKLNSNSLNDIGKLLKIGKKAETGGFSLWLGCMAGNKKAWKKMEEYNRQDVVLLEKVYDRLSPWMHNHPSVARLNGVEGCPTCGSENIVKRGLRATHTNVQQQWTCHKCKGWFLRPFKKTHDRRSG